jgi:hypothetical protein
VAGAAASARRGAGLSGIVELPRRIAALDGAARARAERLLDIDVITSHTDPPASMTEWLTRTFGSLDAVREQRLVRVTNRATLESTVLAALRARRPIESNGDGPAGDLRGEIEASAGDPFCHPEQETPADTFGRVRGRRMLSGANAAQADAHHAVLVFDDHDPLAFDADLVDDLFATGREWAERARADDPAATHYLLMWNCLWRAGGSIIHGHAQALLGRGRPHARIDRFRRDAAAYSAATGADLVADLAALHRDLDLAVDAGGGVTILAHLVPVKEHEVLVVGRPGMDERDPAFARAVGRALETLRDGVGVRSFNLALWRAPLDAVGSPIVAGDPYELVAALRAG